MKFLPCGTRLDVDQRLIERHPVNDRHYSSLVRVYSKWLRASGYDNDDTSCITLVARNSSRDSWLAIGGASRCECVVLTVHEDPDNEFLLKFIAAGGFDATYYSEAMPMVVVYQLVEELNATNSLGVCTTFMQRIKYVARYTTLHAAQPSELEIWHFVKSHTNICGSEIAWKKSVVIFNSWQAITMDSPADTGPTLLSAVSDYFCAHGDVLAMQSQDTNRSVIKYLWDVSSKVLPCRNTDHRGLCKKYPHLMLEAFKLTIPTSDGIPQKLLSEKTMSSLADTVEYVVATDGMVAQTTAKKRPRVATAADGDMVVSTSVEGRKVGVNRLDIIENAIADIKTSLDTNRCVEKPDVVAMARRKMLEFIIDGNKAEVSDGTIEGKTQLTTLPKTIEHFKATALHIHQLTAELATPIVMNHMFTADGSGEHNDATVAVVAAPPPQHVRGLTLSVPIRVMKAFRESGLRWLVRANLGPATLKKATPDSPIILKNNAERFVAKIDVVLSGAATLDELCSQFVATGDEPSAIWSAIAPCANDRAEAIRWLESCLGGTSVSNIVAFKLTTVPDDPAPESSDNSDGVVDGGSSRVLSREASDCIDFADPAALAALKDIASSFKKHGYSVANYDCYFNLTTDVARMSLPTGHDEWTLAASILTATKSTFRFVEQTN